MLAPAWLTTCLAESSHFHQLLSDLDTCAGGAVCKLCACLSCGCCCLSSSCCACVVCASERCSLHCCCCCCPPDGAPPTAVSVLFQLEQMCCLLYTTCMGTLLWFFAFEGATCDSHCISSLTVKRPAVYVLENAVLRGRSHFERTVTLITKNRPCLTNTVRLHCC
jgi:hypothetical protein